MSEVKTRIVKRFAGDGAALPVAMVTGAAGGIGAAIVGRLVRAGMSVVMVDRDGARASEVAGGLVSDGLVIEADLSVPSSAAEIMELVGEATGRLDHLVNNAGFNRLKTIRNLGSEDWDAVMAVNLRAPALLAQQGIPFWEARGAGAIVNIGSRVWQSGSIPAYTASKAGIVGLTRSLAVELGRLNVRVNAVAPSYVDTPFTRQTRTDADVAGMQEQALKITPLPRLGTAMDVANAVHFLLSDEASFITGEILHVCGGAQLAAQNYAFVSRD